MKPSIFYPIALCVTLTMSGQAGARDLEKLSSKLSKSITIMKNLVLAKQVAEIGREEHDPLSLIVAYKIAKNASPEKSEALNELLNKKQNKDKNLKTSFYQDVIYEKQNQLIERARKHAAKNNELLAVIGDVISEASKGAGEQVVTDKLAASKSTSYNITYTLDETAALYIEETENSGLVLSIKDEKGNTLCDNNIVSDDGLCYWTPTGSGEVSVTLENTSQNDISYYMMTN